MNLENMISTIGPLDESAMRAAGARQDRLTKPQGSLGRLEEISIRVAGITGQPLPILEKKAILVMAGDHGVVEEGVSAYPQEVTRQMVLNFLAGGAAINVLARHVGARVVVVDMGVAGDLPRHANLVVKKVATGTANIARGPAMRREQAMQAVISGAQVVEAEVERGLNILATGDMGIGNTTPSAAIASALTGRAPEQIVGRGSGVDDSGLERKLDAVRRALLTNKPNAKDGLDVLTKVGGFEIAGLSGAILAAAARRIPIVVDGFISTAAAMIAVTLQPRVSEYLIAGHCSQELGHRLMMEWLGLEPFLDLKMRLGEGSGAALAISLVEAACKTLVEMATFEEAGVADRASP
jgi:nicotinate-nucleotide--dimethylbenzimidazole phosphoribosyltransferase